MESLVVFHSKYMTINEIAKLAGVSRTTVSRYLNGGYVSADKKAVIKKVIDETGYTPSASAQNLRTKKTNYVGVIIPKINSDSISRMVSGISAVLSANGYQMLLACTENHETEEVKYLNLFRENHVDGIILIGTIFTQAHKKALEALMVPVIILGQNIDGYSCIYSDDYNAAHSLGQEIVKEGNNFAMISVTQKDIAVGYNRRQGFIDAIEEAGKHIAENAIFEGNFTMDAGYNLTSQVLQAYPGTDTLICATDTIAAGAIRKLHEMGKEIPRDIQVTGFGDSSLALATTPVLTTVHFYYEEAGQNAAQMLLEEMRISTNSKEKGAIDSSALRKKLQLDFEVRINDSTR